MIVKHMGDRATDGHGDLARHRKFVGHPADAVGSEKFLTPSLPLHYAF